MGIGWRDNKISLLRVVFFNNFSNFVFMWRALGSTTGIQKPKNTIYEEI